LEMTAISITASNVRVVKRSDQSQHTAPAGEAITAGQYIRQDPSTGKFVLGNATTKAEVGDGFIAENSGAVGDAVTGHKNPVVIDVGDALSGLNYGAPAYLADTDGTLADAAGTEAFVVGKVVAGWAGSAKKLLRLEMQYDVAGLETRVDAAEVAITALEGA
jgi:hypothetical protein